MKKTTIKTLNLIVIASLIIGMTSTANATTISDIQSKINENQNVLTGINDSILGLQDEQDLLEEEISDLDAELLNTMTQIGLLEDSIQEKEDNIAVTQGEYEAAKAEEEAQYDAMVSRIQFMYETGETDYLETLFAITDFSEVLNQASYIEAIYEYDRKMLNEYEETKNEVKNLWDQLENEKQSMEADKADMEEQTVYLDGLLAKKKTESANYDAQIARAKQEANALKVKIKQEQSELKKLQEKEQRKAAANGNYSVNVSVSQIINNASGSDLGKQIARYGCQFIGNPYVLGGTSLTNGADCSGFIYRIYADFGYSVSRTSYQQRSDGQEVSYDNAQPGDIICYDGHVALYIGGGYIVHASTAKTGIKLGKATYRSILSVRRIP
ncbi:MAG TPA: NlpC/P60 family protein [Lachnospiraceae bacterium]|nr:NlpC/P60 family protein [Lachnospiraceae bacterium]